MAKFWSSALRLYFGGYDPGAHTTRMTVSLETDALDASAFTDLAERILPGIRRDRVDWVGWFEDATDAMDVAAATLLATSTNNILTILVGTGTGSIGYAGSVLNLSVKSPGDIRGLARQEALFMVDGSLGRGVHFGPKVSVGSGSVMGSVDNTALTTGGGTLFVQAHAISGGTLVPAIFDSADGTTFASLLQVNISTGPRTTSTLITGTVRRYIRGQNQGGVGTTGTLTLVFVRS